MTQQDLQKIGWIVLLIWCAMQSLPAQIDFDNPIILNVETGLSDDYVNHIVKDHNGFMWFGTSEGLNRFDGTRIEAFLHNPNDSNSLVFNNVLDVWPDDKGRIWAGTSLGLSIYDPLSKTFTNYKSDGEDGLSLPGVRVNKVFKDKQGQIWIGMQKNGLALFDEAKQSFETFKFEVEHEDKSVDLTRINSILDITQDIENDSILWLATLTGLLKFNKYTGDYQWYLFQTEDKNAQFLFNSMKEIYQASDQIIFIGSWNGFGYLHKKTGQIEKVYFDGQGEDDHADSRMVKRFLPKSKEVLWVTTSGGLIEYDMEKGEVQEVYFNDPENGKLYGVEYIDEEGVIWSRTSQGVYYYNPLYTQYEIYKYPGENKDFLQNVNRIVESGDKKYLYVIGEQSEGLYLFDRATKQWDVVKPSNYYQNRVVLHGRDIIRINEDSLLIGATFGFYLYEEKKRKLTPIDIQVGDGAPIFRKIVKGDNGEYWVGSRRQGLFRVNFKKKTFTNYKEVLEAGGSDSRFQWVENIFKDSRENIWIRTASGFSVYEKAKDRLINFPFSSEKETPNSFYNVGNFAEDGKGRVWLSGWANGVGMTDPDNLEAGIVKKIRPESGLKENKSMTLVSDANGNIWIDHELGMTKLNHDDLSLEYFSQGYGRPDLNLFSSSLLSSGELALGTYRGFCIFSPDSLIVNKELPKPYLTSFKVFDKELILDRELYTVPSVDLSYKQNFFSFEFSAIGYNLPENITYAYMLEGVDEDWVVAGKRRYASYTNIGGGDYTFKLRASNNEGVWNEQSYNLGIHISTPWWKTWWFWLSVFLVVLGAIIAFFRWRVNQIKKEELMKTDFEKRLANVEMHALRAQMNPHFIFNCLNSIDYYILKNDMEKASDYLNRFSRLIRLILQNSRSNYVNLKDELESLKLYIEMESLRFDEQFDYEVKVAKSLILEDIEIPPMLLQPYVENAIWHGLMQKNGKGKLDLTITKANGHLQCIIEDNGIGREAAMAIRSKSATRRKSMGMQITKDRIGMINKLYNTDATVRIIDMKDEGGSAMGTKVNLEIPL